MKCMSCNIDISSSFKFAISKNECPACGNFLLDEETLALIENIEESILEEAGLIRKEVAHKLAVMLISKYNINLSDHFIKPQVKQNIKYSELEESIKEDEPLKISTSGSFIQEQKQKQIIKAEDILNTIGDVDREQMLIDTAKKRYQMVESVDVTNEDMQYFSNSENAPVVQSNDLSNLFTIQDDILEQERQLRLQKQQQAIKGGGSSAFRRSGS